MKFLCITNIGIEDITCLEIKEILNLNSEIKQGAVIFEGTIEQANKLAYYAQSINRILILKKESIKDIKEKTDKTFRVRCEKIISNEISRDIEIKVGNQIEGKVNLTDPELKYYVYIVKDQYYFGIDLTDDLTKREYRIFGNDTFKSTINYALIRIGDYKINQTLLDPFCNAGQIPIEASLYITKNSPHYYSNKFQEIKEQITKQNKNIKEQKDGIINPNIYAIESQFNYLNNTKKNAKIAGINKSINYSKLDIEWLETKFKEKEIDLIITNPPQFSNKVPPKKTEKILDEFFHQAEFILKDNGKIILALTNPEKILKIANKYNFKLDSKREIIQGKSEIIVYILSKSL